jgi:hypothetical protein
VTQILVNSHPLKEHQLRMCLHTIPVRHHRVAGIPPGRYKHLLLWLIHLVNVYPSRHSREALCVSCCSPKRCPHICGRASWINWRHQLSKFAFPSPLFLPLNNQTSLRRFYFTKTVLPSSLELGNILRYFGVKKRRGGEVVLLLY